MKSPSTLSQSTSYNCNNVAERTM